MQDLATDELLERWLRDEPDAGGEIYRRYYNRVSRFAMKFTRDTGLSEEVASESMARGLEKIRSGSPIKNWTFWLLSVARNNAVMRYRRRLREKAVPDELVDQLHDGPQTVNLQLEMKSLLQEAIQTLTPSCREVIELYCNDLDRDQIAHRLRVRRDTVDRRFARAYASLRQKVHNHVTRTIAHADKSGPVRWSNVAALRPSFRTVIILHHVNDLSREQIARELSVPLETVDARLTTAYQQLGCDANADFHIVKKEAPGS